MPGAIGVVLEMHKVAWMGFALCRGHSYLMQHKRQTSHRGDTENEKKPEDYPRSSPIVKYATDPLLLSVGNLVLRLALGLEEAGGPEAHGRRVLAGRKLVQSFGRRRWVSRSVGIPQIMTMKTYLAALIGTWLWR